MTPKRRKWIRVALIIVAVLAVLLAALPVWFPWLLRPVFKHRGGTYARYERTGYGTFHLYHVTVTNRSGSGRFQAAEVECLLPTAWLWRRWFHTGSGPFVKARSWSWESLPRARASTNSVYRQFQQTQQRIGTLRNWLPRAETLAGVIRVQERAFQIPDAHWNNGRLTASIVPPGTGSTFSLDARLGPRLPWQAHLENAALAFACDLSLAQQADALSVNAQGTWLTNRFELDAQFAPGDSLPQTARFRAESFRIPASLLRLDQYADVTGSIQASWQTNAFALNVTARAVSLDPEFPPIELAAAISGDNRSARIDQARIATPWLSATLSDRTEILFAPPFVSQPVALHVAADLNRLPWLDLEGQLVGTAVVLPSRNQFPEVTFNMSGAGLTFSNVTAQSFVAQGRIEWPQLELAGSELQFDDGSRMLLAGRFDLKTKTFAQARLEMTGSFARRFLPPGFAFDTARLTAQCSGPLNAPEHSGRLMVEGAVLPHARPARIETTWTGTGLLLRQCELRWNTGPAEMVLRGAATLGGATKRLDIAALEFHRTNETRLALEQPITVTWQTRAQRGRPAFRIELSPAVFSGTAGRLQVSANVDWPSHGNLFASADQFDTGTLRDFIIAPRGPALAVERLQTAASWENGPLALQLETAAALTLHNGTPVRLQTQLDMGTNGLAIDRFSVSTAGGSVCSAAGTLPVLFNPAATNAGGLMSWRPDAPLGLRLSTAPDSPVWDQLAESLGILLRHPSVAIELGGTAAAPEGTLTMRIERAQYLNATRALPAVENIQVDAEADGATARVASLSFLLEGQPVHFTGTIPLDRGFWTGLPRKPRWPDWREATARLLITNAQVTAFAAFLPELVAPQGELGLDLELERGGELRGTASLRNARTRPIGSLGPVRNVQGFAQFIGTAVFFTNVTAEVGGQLITAAGRLAWDETLWREKQLPLFDVRLHGTNVPLVRRADAIVRADLDLAATNSVSGPAVLSGQVRLRDSFYLSDLKSLVPGRVAVPQRRPPYFSVERQPFADWRLAIQVGGDEFLRVRSPLFHGVISATLKLEGTLRDPLALGELRVNSGSVTFPFGSLAVQQGFVSMTSDSPHRPQLFITATAQRLGYEIRMEVTGPADEPVVQFSSMPSLSSEQIVLFLTTGQTPQALTATSPVQRAQGVALFVGRNFLSELGIGGGDEGKLTIRSGEQLTETGRPTYEVEYELAPKWSLVGEYDRFGQYNVGLWWEVYSHGGRPRRP